VDTLTVNKRWLGKTKSSSPPRFTKTELKQQQEPRQRKRKRPSGNGDYLTVRPVARKGYGSIAHEAKPNGLLIRGP